MSLTTINGTPACDGLYLLPFASREEDSFSLVINYERLLYFQQVWKALVEINLGIAVEEVILITPMSLVRWDDE